MTAAQRNAKKAADMPNLTAEIELESFPTANGGFSDIYKGKWNYITTEGHKGCRNVAVKVLRLQSSSDEEQARIEKRLLRELAVWKDLDHPNVLELYGTFTHTPRFVSMVSPWYNKGNAVTYLKNLGMGATALVRLQLLYEAAAGLEYLHSRSSVHGDLTGLNILVNDNGQACLCDFGLGNVWEAMGPTFVTSAFAGAVRWMAPELILNNADSDGSKTRTPRSKATDVYSFGSVAYQLLSSEIPYSHIRNDMGITLHIYKGTRLSRPDGDKLLDSWWNYIQKCCSESPEGRPEMSAVRRKFREFREAEKTRLAASS